MNTEDRVINAADMKEAEIALADHARKRKIFGFGTFQERASAVVDLLASIFRNDWFVDFQIDTYERNPLTPFEEQRIVVKNRHSVYIKNTGTGRIRIFRDMWLAPNEFFRDENQHYRKYHRDIPVLLGDPANDGEGYLVEGSPALKTYKCVVITKQVVNN